MRLCRNFVKYNILLKALWFSNGAMVRKGHLTLGKRALNRYVTGRYLHFKININSKTMNDLVYLGNLFIALWFIVILLDAPSVDAQSWDRRCEFPHIRQSEFGKCLCVTEFTGPNAFYIEGNCVLADFCNRSFFYNIFFQSSQCTATATTTTSTPTTSTSTITISLITNTTASIINTTVPKANTKLKQTQH